MKTKSLIIFAAFIFISLLSANEKELEYGLGFAGGMTSGSGFSFRRLNADIGYQFNLGALMDNSSRCIDCFPEVYSGEWYYDEDGIFTDYSYGKSLYANLGASIYKPLHQGNKSCFYLLAGTAGYFFQEEISKQDYIYNVADSVWVKSGQVRNEKNNEYTFNVGAGFGIEYKLSENIRLNLEWPLVFSFLDGDMNIYMYIPQGGIHYYFK